MKAPNKPGESRTIQNPLQISRDELLQAFSKEIIHGNVILLLGHDALLHIPSQEEIINNGELKALQECKGSMEKWMKHIEKTEYAIDPKNYGSLKDFYADYFDNNDSRLETSDINHEIKKLLESKQIRVVLTTTYDPLIEETMKEIWGSDDSFDVKNFLDNEDISSLDKIVLKDDIKPTLYYLFGKATRKRADSRMFGNPDFVIDEEDYIKTLKKWMVKPPAKLMSFISDKRILAIGCKFDYWLFRFFWRAVLETEESPNYKHLLAISLTSSPSDEKLREIFRLYKLQFPEDVNDFLKGLNQTLLELKPKLLAEGRQEGGIFISYCRKDKDKVLNLFYRLKDKGFKVWMDNHLTPGDQYKPLIKSAIEKCAVFVPVLSHAVSTHEAAADPLNENDENFHYYRDVEWNIAQTRYNNDSYSNDSELKVKIIPFALDGYNPSEVKPEIKKQYPQIVDEPHVEVSYNNASFAKFIASIKQALE